MSWFGQRWESVKPTYKINKYALLHGGKCYHHFFWLAHKLMPLWWYLLRHQNEILVFFVFCFSLTCQYFSSKPMYVPPASQIRTARFIIPVRANACGPSTVLNTSCAVSPVVITTTIWDWTIVNPVLQRRKLRHKQIKPLALADVSDGD